MSTKISVTKAAEELLEKSGEPMHYQEITKFILGKCALNGKTPQETVRALISTNSKFIRIAEGVYALSKWKKYKPARFGKDIAFDLLKSSGKPISIFELGNKILKERVFVGKPKTVARNSIRHDERFYLDQEAELVYLTDWRK